MAKNTVPRNRIPSNEFNNAIQEFAQAELEGSFYDMSIELINGGFETEAYIFILATWNFGRFRYAIKDFDINGFRETVKKLYPIFKNIENEQFKTINFDNYENDILEIYETLSKIRGIEYTGASKIMHIKNPNVFVMWDDYIRGARSARYYEGLDIITKGYWCHKKYGKKAKNYFEFLKDMQKLFSHINFQDSTKTFAKAIDEYNYINITSRIKNMQQQEKTA